MFTYEQLKQACAGLVTDLVTYLTGDGSNARKRLANNPTTSKIVGKDGIERTVISAPLGAFWTIPASLAERLTKACADYASLKANKYFSFPLLGEEFEIGKVAFNTLTSENEIWFCKAGLLGSHPMSTEDLISALKKQEVKRMVTPVDVTGMKSAVTSDVPVPQALKY